MKIRLENKEDHREVENLTREAFWNVYRPGCFEHYVIHELRNDSCFIPQLDYVVEENGEIIANIVYAKANIEKEDGNREEVVIFGPVSVLPRCQGRGIGSKLIRYTLEQAEAMGYPLVLITGNPEFYKRFGFVSASEYGISYNGFDKTEELPFFMAQILNKERAKNISGVYSDPKCYAAEEEKVDEFDKAFPPKVKEKREGQLTQ